MTQDLEELRTWIGRIETDVDYVTIPAVHRLSATLDRDDPMPKFGEPLPIGWQSILFPRIVRHSQVGVDGHPKRGDFLPPVPLPRRMWAGGRLEFRRPLRVGEALQRDSEILAVEPKHGKSGSLVFVTVRQTVRAAGEIAVVEEQDIVYRDAAKPADPKPQGKAAPASPAWSRELAPDPVLLFRFSALTFNGHRIHYDRRYVTEVEGYPGLVVHGPLIATLLVDLARRQRPDAVFRTFSFKAVRPTFDLHPFCVSGTPAADAKSAQLWAQDHEGWLTMQAKAQLA
jgi:3-methylfumaryl-CoA hydratase